MPIGPCFMACSYSLSAPRRRTVDWARRRYQMGLGGFGMPWEDAGLDSGWSLLRRPDLEEVG